jgi:hypothetical protein
MSTFDARPSMTHAAPPPTFFERPAVQAISTADLHPPIDPVPAVELDGAAEATFVPGPRPAGASRAQLEPRPALRPRPPARRTDAPGSGHGPTDSPGTPPPMSVPAAAPVAHEAADDGQSDRGATGPQLRRFIKSRAYVPMHELRRRFAINGHDDEVTPVDLEHRRVFVGLPDREGRLLADLLRGGDIGYELSMDPITPIVVGVYPMRPVTRP